MRKYENIFLAAITVVLWVSTYSKLGHIAAIAMTFYVGAKVLGIRLTVANATDKDKKEK